MSQSAPAKTCKAAPRRAWPLTLVTVVAALASGAIAMLIDGTPRAAFGGASIVFLIAAFFCAGITSLESHDDPPFDPDEPAPTPPVPQSPITLVYDPGEMPKPPLERDLERR